MHLFYIYIYTGISKDEWLQKSININEKNTLVRTPASLNKEVETKQSRTDRQQMSFTARIRYRVLFTILLPELFVSVN